MSIDVNSCDSFSATIAIVGPCPEDNAILAGQIREFNRGWRAVCHRITECLADTLPPKLPQLAIINNGKGEPRLTHWIQIHRLRIPALRMLIYGDLSAASLLIPCLRAGACGWLDKPASSSELELAIQEALAGGNPISHKARQILVAFFQRPPARIAAMWHLTKREFQILSSLAHPSNPSDKEIAQDLNLSPGTIHAHLAHIYAKLQVHNRQEAIDKWLSNAL